MSNLNSITNYKIDGHLLNSLLSIYKLIGTNNYLAEKLSSRDEAVKKNTLEENCAILNNRLSLCDSKERSRLIITKDSKPLNLQEKSLAELKWVLKDIEIHQSGNEPLNIIDLLDYLKRIYGKHIKLNTQEYSLNNPNKKSVRYLINNLCDEYNQLRLNNAYEPIIISSIFLMEMYNLRPFDSYNEPAFLLMFYILLRKCEIMSLNYTSFYALFLKYEIEINEVINSGSVNYDSGVLYINDFVKLVIRMIQESYSIVDEMANKVHQEKRAFKHDNITKSIIEDLPRIFSKEDVKRLYPNASDSTIVRALNSLKKKNFITPLGSGRGARWQRLIDKNSLIYLFGESNEDN